MLLACSHLVIATADVPRMTRFFSAAFGLEPHFANDLFAEFVLPSRFRVAFFVPVGKSARSFDATASRGSSAFGVTVDDVEASYRTVAAMTGDSPNALSGPPKEHPWGEKSFLLTDPDGNRWEVAQTPAADGMLVDR